MICGNDKCKRKVEQPLELYDGSWACPYCKHEIASMSGNFRMTPLKTMLTAARVVSKG